MHTWHVVYRWQWRATLAVASLHFCSSSDKLKEWRCLCRLFEHVFATLHWWLVCTHDGFCFPAFWNCLVISSLAHKCLWTFITVSESLIILGGSYKTSQISALVKTHVVSLCKIALYLLLLITPMTSLRNTGWSMHFLKISLSKSDISPEQLHHSRSRFSEKLKVRVRVSWSRRLVFFADLQKTKVDQNCYIDLLKTSLLPECHLLYPGSDFIFMQDTVLYHTMQKWHNSFYDKTL